MTEPTLDATAGPPTAGPKSPTAPPYNAALSAVDPENLLLCEAARTAIAGGGLPAGQDVAAVVVLACQRAGLTGRLGPWRPNDPAVPGPAAPGRDAGSGWTR